jgi:acyl carrier protein
MMTQGEALNWVAKLFEEPVDELSPNTSRESIIAWDSLGVLTLMASLDSDFGIILSDDQLQGMKKVEDILVVLRKNGALE